MNVLQKKCLCVGGEEPDTKYAQVGIDKDELWICYDGCACGAFSETIKIKYCPMCGRKLEE